ncbi:MAG: hypothetical protein RL311_1281 [Bacteroidota bacterium]|jgi:hypothetical protein
MDTSLNIVELIENNPITRLSGTYQNKLLTKIKHNFTDTEQQLFVASFYCFLNYSQRNDFVIDLDNIWKWMGYNQKFKAKFSLEKNFKLDIDYKILLCQPAQQKNVRGGHNKETILLTIRTFKLFCLKAGTEKAAQIHEYYIKMEETLQEVIQEESDELKLQLENKDTELANKDTELANKDTKLANKDKELEKKDKEKDKIREKTLIEQFPNNAQCVYYGIIDNLSQSGEKLIKFGNSNNLKNRVVRHKDTYSNFRLVNAFKVENKLQIENAIKENQILNKRQRELTINNKKYIELLNIDGLSFTELDKIIQEIITSIEYTPENYEKLLNENTELKKKLSEDKELNELILLKIENQKLKIENIKLIKKYNTLIRKTKPIILDEDEDDAEGKEDLLENYEESINEITNEKKDAKNIINGKVYKTLIWTREEVYKEISYKTTGGLTKDDLLVNKNWKIVSKKKCILETQINRLEAVNLKKKKVVNDKISANLVDSVPPP